MDAAQQFTLSTRLNLEPGYPDIQPGFEIKSLEISLDEHVIRGDGCLLLLEPPALHLDMKAPSMELGDLTLLVEKWAAPGAEFKDSPESADELPIELAVRLVIDQASYDDALAEGVRITAGSAPNCPGGL